MKVSLPIFVSILLQFLVGFTFAQKKSEIEYKPFSILIINPDSISLDESLKPLIDTVESTFREVYYSYLKQLELSEKFEPEETRRDIKLQIQRVRLAEMDVHNTTYLQLIGMMTCSELWDLFNGDSNEEFYFDFISREELFSYDLQKISSYYEVDYILTYKKITTPIVNNELALKIEIQLFSRKEARIIFEKASYGYARFYKNNSGELQACANDLQCLIESSTISSSADLFTFLKRKQKK